MNRRKCIFAAIVLTPAIALVTAVNLLPEDRQRDLFFEVAERAMKSYGVVRANLRVMLARLDRTNRTWRDPATGYKWRYVVNDGKAEIVNKVTGGCAVSPPPSGTLVVPRRVGGFPVAKIGEYAFVSCFTLKRIVIPDTVVKIGESMSSLFAVFGSRDLVAVEVDPGNAHYKSIHGALYDKDGATLLHVPQGVTEIVVPEGVRAIAAGAFFMCAKLRTLELPATVREIGNTPFSVSGLDEVHFRGDAPKYSGYNAKANDMYALTSEQLVTYVRRGSRGWAGTTNGIPRTWQGRPLRLEE